MHLILIGFTAFNIAVFAQPIPTATPVNHGKGLICDPSAFSEDIQELRRSSRRSDVKLYFLERAIKKINRCGLDPRQIKVAPVTASTDFDGDYRQPQNVVQLADQLSIRCVSEMRKYIANEKSRQSVAEEIESLNVCGTRIGRNPEALKTEVEKLSAENKALIEARKLKCPPASVDTSAMGPPRNQGNSGWCYAHAVADLVSFHLGKRISAIDLAINNNDSLIFRLQKRVFNSSEFSKSGGQIEESFNKINATGFCADENLIGDETTLAGVRSAFEDYREIEKLMIRRDQGEISNSEACEQAFGLSKKIAPLVSQEGLTALLTSAPKSSFFDQYRNLACGRRLKFDHDKKIEFFWGGEKGVDRLDRILEAGEPAAVSYKAAMIGLTGFHANVVIGRRFNEIDGSCEYQIRNTWGTNNPLRDDGTFWISKSEFVDNLTHGIALTK